MTIALSRTIRLVGTNFAPKGEIAYCARLKYLAPRYAPKKVKHQNAANIRHINAACHPTVNAQNVLPNLCDAKSTYAFLPKGAKQNAAHLISPYAFLSPIILNAYTIAIKVKYVPISQPPLSPKIMFLAILFTLIV